MDPNNPNPIPPPAPPQPNPNPVGLGSAPLSAPSVAPIDPLAPSISTTTPPLPSSPQVEPPVIPTPQEPQPSFPPAAPPLDNANLSAGWNPPTPAIDQPIPSQPQTNQSPLEDSLNPNLSLNPQPPLPPVSEANNLSGTILPSNDQPPQAAPLDNFGLPPVQSAADVPTAPEGSLPHNDFSEPAPTDLSQLSSINPEPPANPYAPPVSNSETLVVPPSPIPESVTPEEPKHKFPKKLLFGGLGVIIVVLAASLYFILGVGKGSTSAPASVPASPSTQLPLTNPSQVVTQPTPAAPAQAASSSAGFGDLNTPTSSQSATQGKSALQILQEQKNASSSGNTH